MYLYLLCIGVSELNLREGTAAIVVQARDTAAAGVSGDLSRTLSELQ